MEDIHINKNSWGHPEQHSWLWVVLLNCVVRPWLQLWYKRITITGRENIPRGKPIIFAPNHQNGMIDTLMVLSTSRRQIVWLARADAFQKSFIAKCLRFFRVLPIYKMQDGVDMGNKNDAIFEKSFDVLKNNNEIGIFPEDKHWGLQRLRPCQKTIAQLAFMAEERSNFDLDVQIVPVGITYSHYSHFHHNVLVQYGKPIVMKQFQKEYSENPQRAMLELRQTIDAALLELMIHIPSEEYYAEMNQLLLTCDFRFMREMGETKKHLIRKFVTHKQLIDVLLKHITLAPFEAQELFQRTKQYRLLLADLKMHDSILDKSHGLARICLAIAGLLVFLPVFIFGFVINIVPFNLPYRKIVEKNQDDPQMIATFTLASSVIVFPLWYTMLCLLISAFADPGLLTPLLYVSFAVSGIVAFHWRRTFMRTWQRIRLRVLKSHNEDTYNLLFGLRNELIATTMKIFEQHRGAWGKKKKRNM